jgi:CheY-like chemotaxis protein
MQKLIFVVDDNDANLLATAAVLDEDYLVLTMPSAKRMFEVLGKKRPDLILLDIEMPEINGHEAIVTLKENPELKDIPVLFLTGWIDDELIAKSLGLGALEVIEKSTMQENLLRKVTEYLKG